MDWVGLIFLVFFLFFFHEVSENPRLARGEGSAPLPQRNSMSAIHDCAAVEVTAVEVTRLHLLSAMRCAPRTFMQGRIREAEFGVLVVRFCRQTFL